MLLFTFLSKDCFSDCNIEAYSFWVKKRVLVFEYGIEGKIKLSVEPFDQQGALIDFTVRQCKFQQTCGSGIDAMFIYSDKHLVKPIITVVVARKNFTDLDQINLLETKHKFIECLDENLVIKLILATDNLPRTTVESLSKIFDKILILKYDSYIGRQAEVFMKTLD